MGFPSCQRCNCTVEGSINDDPCITPCICKVHTFTFHPSALAKKNTDGPRSHPCQPYHHYLHHINTEITCPVPAASGLRAINFVPFSSVSWTVFHSSRKTWREKTATAANWDSTTFKVTIDAAARNAPVWACPVSAPPPHGPIRMYAISQIIFFWNFHSFLYVHFRIAAAVAHS